MSIGPQAEQPDGLAIAVVGMAGRFPGASNPAEFWANLRDGVESIRFFSQEELAKAGEDPTLLTDPQYVPASGALQGMDLFDAPFFGFNPRDAAIMDPQHRQFLECAWEAIEDAGYVPEHYDGSIGVFAGSGQTGYLMHNLLTNPDLMHSVGDFLIRHTGNDKDFLTTRLSYCLNLTGPSINVQTACSTSLVAIHLACQSLLNGECDMALAGGVTIMVPHERGYLYKEGEILSPDGHCRSFDADSKGTVFGSGVGVVILKRLSDALADGDTIRAIVRGSAINNDGSLKVGYMAPSVDGQAKAISEAIGLAGIGPETISYVETHGTGTPIGDPIEITALTQAFREETDRTGFCAIGSVKSNIGHLDTAAGVAGFMKTVLALQHQQLPPSLNFRAPNPQIDFARSPFFVNASLRDWPAGPLPRRAGVSSLGVGGTNAHIILEEAPVAMPTGPSRPWQLLMLSARTPTALDGATARLREHLVAQPEVPLADIAYTLQRGRKTFAHRRFVVAHDAADAAAVLAGSEPKRLLSGQHTDPEPAYVFMFPGGGAQYPGMAADLYRAEPIFRATIDECATLLTPILGQDIRQLLYPANDRLAEVADQLRAHASLALPALFATEYALARLLMAWGLQPAAMIGHSLGEYAAACLAEVITLPDALAMVTLRGRLFEKLPAGGMLSIPLPEAEVQALLPAQLSLAAVNAPSLSVVSGPVQAIAELEQSLAARGIDCRRIQIDVAAHSAMLETILPEFEAFVRTITLRPPTLPFISNLSGTWATPAEVTSPQYWVRHLRQTVRFADGIATVLGDPKWLLLEVGPGRTLTTLAQQHPQKSAQQSALSTLRHPNDRISDQVFLLTALGRIWLAGGRCDWTSFYAAEERRRVPLPTYAFDHQRYWIEPGQQRALSSPQAARRRADVAEWGYLPSWKRTTPMTGPIEGADLWLLLGDTTGLSQQIARQLARHGQRVITVLQGRQFAKVANDIFVVDPGDREQFIELIRSLRSRNLSPRRIVHLWNVGAPPRRDNHEVLQHQSFYSLLYLAQALSAQALSDPLHLSIVSSAMQRIASETEHHPERALLLGPCHVIPTEFPHITCSSIDVVTPHDRRLLEQLAAQVIAETAGGTHEPVVAYRGLDRWVQTYEPTRLDPQPPAQPRLRVGGVYLITGGLGGLGLAVAEHLARTYQARLVLIGRTGLPGREQWPQWLEHHSDTEPTSRRIHRVRALEQAGAEVLVIGADIADQRHMEAAIRQARKRFGAIHGVFHAAGVLDDGLVDLKSADSARRVLLPKLHGTLVLDRLLDTRELDCFVLFSSVSAFMGLPGQVDYAAANAFLDAFAQAKANRGHQSVISINWSAWQEVGMAANLSASSSSEPMTSAHGRTVGHPLVETCLTEGPDEIIYSTILSVAKHWVLDDHRLKDGLAVLPGTAYIELIRAALADHTKSSQIEIQGLFFVAPLPIGDDESRELRVKLTRNGLTYACEVSSRSVGGGQGSGWQEHAHCFGTTMPEGALGHQDLSLLAQRCTERERFLMAGEPSTRQENHLTFGPRWRNLRWTRFGVGEALAELELPEEFVLDTADYAIHPALLDLATGYPLPLVEGYAETEGLFVPATYRSIRIAGPLPRRIYSHARLKDSTALDNGVVVVDVKLLDDQGNVLVEIEDFMMKQVDGNSLFTLNTGAVAEVTTADGQSVRQFASRFELKDGILTAEGLAVLERVVNGPLRPQVIISPQPLEAVIERQRAAHRPGAAEETATVVGLMSARPHLGTPFEAPSTDVERTIATIWEETLGVQGIGIHDDLFELGGHSLIAIRMFNRIEQVFGCKLPLSTLFEAPTIGQLATLIGDNGAAAEEVVEEKWSSLVAVRGNGDRAPFFLVHGGGGNVLNFRDVTRYLSLDQPVYGLQAQGLDGEHALHERIEDMASHYISEIRGVQPEGPYCLGGYCLGGLVAWEMAQQLRAQGQEVAILVLIETYAPGHEMSLRFQAHWYVHRAFMHLNNLAHLSPPTMIGYARSRIETLQWRLKDVMRSARWRATYQYYRRTGQELPTELHDHFQMARVAMTHYTPSTFTGQPILFIARDRGVESDADPYFGWGGRSTEPIEIIKVPGDHNSMFDMPYVKVLADTLQQCLDKALANQPVRSASPTGGATIEAVGPSS